MISLFRKIRQKLLAQSRITRYLTYAIGEIFLVSIGILIALQANNWNEQRKSKIQELELLKSLKIELERDLSDIDLNVSIQKRVMASGNLLLQKMEEDAPYSDSLAIHFSRTMLPTNFLHSTSTFETIKSKGVDLISNLKVRNKTIEVFDSHYKFFLQEQSGFHDFMQFGLMNIFPGRFTESYSYDLYSTNYEGKLTPVNFSDLAQDGEFLYFFKSYLNRNMVFVEVNYGSLRAQVTLLLDLLEEEIKKLERR